MARLFRRALAVSTATTISSFALLASAHTVLVAPPPLTGNDSAKTGPCGCTFGSGTIICPNDYTVTEFQAGEQISITWNETVNHDGDFRVSFSDKAPEDVTVADMDGATLQMTVPDDQAGGLVTKSFTLPDTPCDLCTIQVRQYMMGADPPYYFTCAAIKIVAGASTSGAGGGAASGSGGGASGPSSGAGSEGGGQPVWEPEPQSGCTVATRPEGDVDARSLGSIGLVAAGLALGVRRRRSGRIGSSR
jgi:hypothetical protein